MTRKTVPQSLKLDAEQLLHRKPGYLIRRLQQMAVSIFLEETAEFDVTPVQYAAIAAVCVFPGIDQLRLANAIGFDRTTISGVVDRLEAKGLVVRKVSGRDRRAKLLFATAAGSQLLKEIQEATDRVQHRILAPLSRPEQKTFLEFLNRLVLSHNDSSRVPVNNDLTPTRKPRSGKQEPECS
jgi:DNA-binding MarR family transcriptional regulator